MKTKSIKKPSGCVLIYEEEILGRQMTIKELKIFYTIFNLGVDCTLENLKKGGD